MKHYYFIEFQKESSRPFSLHKQRISGRCRQVANFKTINQARKHRRHLKQFEQQIKVAK